MSIIEEIAGTSITFWNGQSRKKVDISNIFGISEEELAKEFANQASLFAYFSTLQAQAEREVAIASYAKDTAYAEADEYWRAYLDKREKKYTEAVIRSSIIRDEDYISRDSAYNDTLYELNVIKGIVKALQMRAEMLISLGAHLRQEYEMTGMRIKDREYDKAIMSVKDMVRAKKSQV